VKISTKGRYGVLAMFDLALSGNEVPVSLKSIADRQSLSEHYLEQLFGPLRKAGLVRSVRGAQGGYLLARDPDSITVGDIVRVLEGPIAPVECVQPEAGGDEKQLARDCCGRPEVCPTRPVWEKLRDAMVEALDSVSLGDLVRQARERRPVPMYYI